MFGSATDKPYANGKRNGIIVHLKKSHLITEGLYVAGSLADWRSHYTTDSGRGSHVVTDILTVWNDEKHVGVDDKIEF